MAAPRLWRGKRIQLIYLAMVRLGPTGASGTSPVQTLGDAGLWAGGVPAVLTTLSAPLLPPSRTGTVAARPGEYSSAFSCSSPVGLYSLQQPLFLPHVTGQLCAPTLSALWPAPLGYQLMPRCTKGHQFCAPPSSLSFLLLGSQVHHVTQLLPGAFTVIGVISLECNVTQTQRKVPLGRAEQSLLTGWGHHCHLPDV